MSIKNLIIYFRIKNINDPYLEILKNPTDKMIIN